MSDKKSDIDLDDEKDLDEIFEGVKNSKINKAMKKAKRFSTLKIIIISFSTFLILSFALFSTGEKVIYKKWNNYISNIDDAYKVKSPNKFTGMFYTYKNFFSAETEYKTFKYISGKRVYTGSESFKFDLLKENYIQGDGNFVSYTEMTDEELNFLNRYNDIGQKLMVFYYPYVEYGNRYSNDLSILDEISDDKYMELALSFDKQYSMEQVNNMIPDGIDLTWYWVDAVDDSYKETQKYYINKQEDGQSVEQYAELCYENFAYGFKTINEYGEKIKDPEKHFIEALKEYDKDNVYEIIAGKDKKITKEDIKVQGIVVTGDSESLKVLKNMPFIKASSLGVVVDKY